MVYFLLHHDHALYRALLPYCGPDHRSLVSVNICSLMLYILDAMVRQIEVGRKYQNCKFLVEKKFRAKKLQELLNSFLGETDIFEEQHCWNYPVNVIYSLFNKLVAEWDTRLLLM